MSSLERKFDQIPKKYLPLYHIPSRQVITKAREMVIQASVEEQRQMLTDPAFSRIVSSALIDLDEHRQCFEPEIVSAFSQDNRELAGYIFSELEG